MLIGTLCGGGKLWMIIMPSRSVISLFPVPGSFSCISLAFTCQADEGTVRVMVLITLASGEGPSSGAGVHVCPFSSSLLVRAASTEWVQIFVVKVAILIPQWWQHPP